MVKSIKYIIFIIVVSTSFQLFSQNIEILDITVEGLERLDKDDIFRISKLYPGSKITRGDEINQSISRLWKIQRFSNIQFFLDKENELGIYLKIIVNELPYQINGDVNNDYLINILDIIIIINIILDS